MSRKARHKFGCECGKEFEAWVYESVNVTVNPELKYQSFLPGFNTVECPGCGEVYSTDLRFIYHDMDKSFWIWVYPEEAREYEDEVHETIAEEMAQMKETLPEIIFENSALKNYNVVFGKDNLMEFLLKNDPDFEAPVQCRHFSNGIKHFEQGNLQEAITCWKKAISSESDDSEFIAEAYFNIACAESKLGNMDKAFESLNRAIEYGVDSELVKFDPDMAELRKDLRFIEILKKL